MVLPWCIAPLPEGRAKVGAQRGGRTRISLTSVNTTAIVYKQKVGQSLKILMYAIAVVSTNVRELRVDGNLSFRV